VKQAKDLITALFDREHARQAASWSSLFSGWRSVVGEDLAAHSRVVDVRHGTLVVEVDHPGWLQLLRLREASILGAIKSRYAPLEIERMKVVTDAKPPAVSNEAPPAAPNESEVAELRGVESEGHEEFRNLLERVRKLGE
jgi:predicted nucleic acid-binding Zn ribbon protein